MFHRPVTATIIMNGKGAVGNGEQAADLELLEAVMTK
jgi:hypothetical protein